MTQPVTNPLHEQLCNWLRDNPAPQSTPSSDSMNPMVIAKLFDAFGSATWWVTEYDRVSRLTFGFGFDRRDGRVVICPPHLVYKWRREIKETVPNARVWILNGPDTLTKLLQIRAMRQQKPSVPEFFVMGRVRMRLGYHWRPGFIKRKVHGGEMPRGTEVCQCPDCFEWITDEDGAPFTDAALATVWLNKQQCFCRKCHGALWTLMRPGTTAVSRRELLLKALTGLPTIGSVTAAKLLDRFGEEMIAHLPILFSETQPAPNQEGLFAFIADAKARGRGSPRASSISRPDAP